jgi:hypothetical protein
VSKESGAMFEKPKKKKLNRYSISVSGKTYERLREHVTSGSVASFVDEVVTMALDDPAISSRIVAQSQQEAP